MGKEESVEDAGEAEADSGTSEETKEETTPEDTEPEATEQSAKKKKEDIEKLRTVIKVNEGEAPAEEQKEKHSIEETSTEEKKEEAPKPTIPKAPQAPAVPTGGSRDDLEQRRNMLQSIKDFDFQIKKNQEDIGKMIEKLDGLTKDLDDLVSLYEIVSEQMNPFVGLSKVTKKRIDALENFTKEIEDIKIRMGDVESVVEKSVGGITRLTKKLDEKKPTPDSSETANNLESELENAEIQIDESSDETVAEPEVNITESVNISSTSMETPSMTGDLSDDDLDILLSKSLESLLAEQNIDYMINEFLLSLK